MTLPNSRPLRWLGVPAFAAAYLALDAASFIDPLHGLNLTPWNPAPALSLVYLLRGGPAARLSVLLAVLLAESLIRGLQAPWWPGLLAAALLGAGYLLLGQLLARRLPAGSLLDDRRTLFAWAAGVAGGTLLLSLLHVSTLTLSGLLPPAGWLAGTLRFWIGDGVGIAVAMPLFWWLSSPRGRQLLGQTLRMPETAAYALLSLAATWIALSDGDAGFRMAYLLFLPIVWASARQGMAGAILSASLLQIEIVSAAHLLDFGAVTLAEFQMLSLAMALIGFFIGAIVDEQRRTSEELRHSLRLAAAGEMAGALAHELNQPLTALAAYAAACETLLARGEQGERLRSALGGVLRESSRAGDVLHRLRDFFRTGATRLETLRADTLIGQAIEACSARATREGVNFQLGPLPAVELLADRLQLEVVLRNLLANAMDAMSATPAGARTIAVQGELLPGPRLCVTIEDSGPGLSADTAARLFEPFRSDKSSGLGLGLAISRAIVETHGGSLCGEVASHGIFRLTLPVQETA
jgi:signal transduction histidine kinase